MNERRIDQRQLTGLPASILSRVAHQFRQQVSKLSDVNWSCGKAEKESKEKSHHSSSCLPNLKFRISA